MNQGIISAAQQLKEEFCVAEDELAHFKAFYLKLLESKDKVDTLNKLLVFLPQNSGFEMFNNFIRKLYFYEQLLPIQEEQQRDWYKQYILFKILNLLIPPNGISQVNFLKWILYQDLLVDQAYIFPELLTQFENKPKSFFINELALEHCINSLRESASRYQDKADTLYHVFRLYYERFLRNQ